MSRTRLLALGIAILIAGGIAIAVVLSRPAEPVPAPEADGPDLFEDVTAKTGIAFAYSNGEEANLSTILESLGGGVAAFDYDGDGKIDLFFTGGGSLDGKVIRGKPSKLFRNLGDWKFQDVSWPCLSSPRSGERGWTPLATCPTSRVSIPPPFRWSIRIPIMVTVRRKGMEPIPRPRTGVTMSRDPGFRQEVTS